VKPEPARVVEAAKPVTMPPSKQAPVDAKESVFTVIAGPNRGSGFVVAADGFLITSEKTVRGQQLIKIKSSSGRESLGFVVRRDELNDIALVRLTERDLPPLGVRVAPLVPADEVYTLEPPGSRQGAGAKRLGSVVPSENAAKVVRTSVQLAALDAGTPFFDKDGKVVGVAILSASAEGGKVGGAGYVPITEALSRLALGFR
ncbi:MAG: trypsin-like peptidase domain-containing protein, partial [Rhodoferax sp.]